MRKLVKFELQNHENYPEDIKNGHEIKLACSFFPKRILKSSYYNKIKFVSRYSCSNQAYKATKSEINNVNIELNLVA